MIVAGTGVLSWPLQAHPASAGSTLAVLGACLGWAIDNKLTRKVSLTDASFIAMIKGSVAGRTNHAFALTTNAHWPGAATAAAAALLVLASYGA